MSALARHGIIVGVNIGTAHLIYTERTAIPTPDSVETTVAKHG